VDPPVAHVGFSEGCAISETPRCIGRGIAAIAADPDRSRCNQQAVTVGGLAAEYAECGSADLDGSQPDARRYLVAS
jgi:hypothetical protein